MSSDSRPGTDAPPVSGSEPGPVLVTGGTGFVGSHLVEALLAHGHREIRCLVRSSPGWLDGIPHTPVPADLSEVEPLARALEGCETVYHVAGRTRARTWEELEDANVTGTLNLLEAAASLKEPPRVLLVSSLAAVGRSAAPVADEDTPLRPVSMYGRSKAEMEARMRPFHDRLDITVVRPSSVYGPRDTDIFTVFKTARLGLFAVVGGTPGPAVTLVHVRDLAQGIIQAATSPETIGKTYFLGADPPHSWNEMRDAAAAALGRRLLTVRVPAALVVPVGTAVETAGRLFGAYPPLNREKALEIRDACIMCTSQRALRDFGYRPSIPLREGFAESVSWYRRKGWL